MLPHFYWNLMSSILRNLKSIEATITDHQAQSPLTVSLTTEVSSLFASLFEYYP